jgi:hypothetical protein
MKPRAAATPTRPAAAAAALPLALRGATAEHIDIASDEGGVQPAEAARTLRATFTLANPVRRTGARLKLYAEGVLEVVDSRRDSGEHRAFLDLQFLDPVPRIERVVAVRCLYAALTCGATAALAAFLLRFDTLRAEATAVLAAAALAAVTALALAIYRSYERTEFYTLHGRSRVLNLVASVGSIKKVRACVPALRAAIEEAAERIGSDKAAHLRAEMREHYRLRSDGILDNDECAAATGRILAQFDVRV